MRVSKSCLLSFVYFVVTLTLGILFSFMVSGCQIPTTGPTVGGTPTPTVSPEPTPSVVPSPTPTARPEAPRPCVLVEEVIFNAKTDQTVWQPSYYYTPKKDVLTTFSEDGVGFCGGSGCRAGITLNLGNRDISMCPSLAIRVQGTIFYQSLGGAGYDNREAPIAVMIQYTDINGVKHSSLNAFNEGEPDDRFTTRLFWHGFGYLDTTNSFFGNFTPSITMVTQSVPFDQTIDFMGSLSPKPAIIHTITIEGSGWSLDSVVKQFAMKPYEAFQNPNAPYQIPDHPAHP